MARHKNDLREIKAQRLGYIRSKHNETQKELAEAIGVSESLVKMWESYQRDITDESVVAIAKHYNVSIDYLFGNISEPSNEPNLKALSEYTGLSRKAIDTIAEYNNHCKKESMWNSIDAIFGSESYFINNQLTKLFDYICYAKQTKQVTEQGYRVDQSDEDEYIIQQLKKKGYYLIPFNQLEARFKEDATDTFKMILLQLLDGLDSILTVNNRIK